MWHRCGEGCSSGSSLPVDCDPAYAPAVAGSRDAPSTNQSNIAGINPSQPHPGLAEGEPNNPNIPQNNQPRYPVIHPLVDNVQEGVHIQRGGSLPNPVASSMIASAQSGPGGRASSLSSSQASRSSTAPVPQTPTTSAFSALIWKMNERGPTGIHTPAALASLAELLTNPPTVPVGQSSCLTSALGAAGITIPESTSMEKTTSDLESSMEQKSCDDQIHEQKAKVRYELLLIIFLTSILYFSIPLNF